MKTLLELFVLVNLGFLALDIFLAHSVNRFGHPAEYVPLVFSLVSPWVLVGGLVGAKWLPRIGWILGLVVGWGAVAIGLVGTLLHLDSHFFQEQTLRSLVYSAPFAAPLAYTGLGLLLLLNRMVQADSEEWARWVLLLALGGFVGNFIFSLADHAQNGFFYHSEWLAVAASGLTVGFLTVPFLLAVDQRYLALCGGVLVLQAGVGVLGAGLHLAADLSGPSPRLFDNLVHGAPILAPLLFPNLGLLAGLGLWSLAKYVPGRPETRV